MKLPIEHPKQARAAMWSLLFFGLVGLWPGLSRTPKTVEQPTEKTESFALSKDEQIVFDKINAHRKSKGLKALAVCEPCITEARKHSENMAKGKVAFGHGGVEKRIEAIKKSLGTKYAAWSENVAWNLNKPDPNASAVEQWLNSPPHKKNLEGDYAQSGVGIYKHSNGKIYFTQIFFTPK